MNCPTCAETMENIGQDAYGGGAVYWCPKCGTRTREGGEVHVPRIVPSFREFIEQGDPEKKTDPNYRGPHEETGTL